MSDFKPYKDWTPEDDDRDPFQKQLDLQNQQIAQLTQALTLLNEQNQALWERQSELLTIFSNSLTVNEVLFKSLQEQVNMLHLVLRALIT